MSQDTAADNRDVGTDRTVAALVASAVGVSIDDVQIVNCEPVWRGPFRLDDVAVGCVATATAAVASLAATRNGEPFGPVGVDARHAAASFLTETLVDPDGWTIPPIWDPIAGDYQSRDGWIRLHTNYPHHRAAALEVLGISDHPSLTRNDITPRVAEWDAEDLETAVVAANGVAGRQRSADQWQRHPAGLAVGAEPLLEVEHVNASAAPLPPGERPLSGVRVLDLTRVLAGPTATGVLASWGAEVLRIDPPGFAEVPAIVPAMTSGKRTTALDLAQSVDRQRFVELLATADVVVHGYRPGALHSVGLDPSSWQLVRPGLVDVCLDAYGWRGPWKDQTSGSRRGGGERFHGLIW